MDALREGFRNYFGDGGPELPPEPPPSGSVSGGRWTVQWVIHRDQRGAATTLDFLAEYGHGPLVHGRVTADGTAHTVGTFLEHYVFNPAIDADDAAARARMEQHNREVASELERVGLL